MSANPNYLSKIPELRKSYYSVAVNQEHLLKLITESEIGDQVYNSNAIENSTLTLEETEKILLQIEIDRTITQREIFEARNLARVVSYMDQHAQNKPVTLELLLHMHGMLLANINDSIAGRFRHDTEFVRVGTYIAPAPFHINDLLYTLLADFYGNIDQHIIRRIAQLHIQFERIHPFLDGNGRIGRVLNNYLLLREGYVPITIQYAERSEYYDAFREFELHKTSKIMERIIGRALTNSYYKRLAYLEHKKIVVLSEYAEQVGMSIQNAINKAKRQTIPAFLEKNQWKVGI